MIAGAPIDRTSDRADNAATGEGMATDRLIHVEFVDAASGATFSQADVPADQLPTSFEARTTVNLQGQEWEIVAATPMTRAEFELAGKLRLSLSKITTATMPAGDILFSLPTICDFIPGITPGTSKLGKQVLELHEDDWRQIELVATSRQSEIDVGLAAVRAIYDHEREPGGAFRKLHVREEAADPLGGCNLPLATLSRCFPAVTALDGIAYRDVAGVVEGGFALRSPCGLCLYGVQTAGVVTTLGLQPQQISVGIEEDARSLASLMRDHDLCLVDWCRVYRCLGSDADVAAYLAWWSTRGASP
jgi:hypothetical protein